MIHKRFFLAESCKVFWYGTPETRNHFFAIKRQSGCGAERDMLVPKAN